MKKTVSVAVGCFLCAGLAGCGVSAGAAVGIVFLMAAGLLLLALAGMQIWKYIRYNHRYRDNPRRKQRKGVDVLTWVLCGLGVALLLAAIPVALFGSKEPGGNAAADTTVSSTPPSAAETTEPPMLFAPAKTQNSDPANWGICWEIFENGVQVNSYNRPDPISFGDPQDYFALPGIAAFRGNNYRNSPTYGTAQVVEKTIETVWDVDIGSLDRWSGSGWTGQPLIVKWDEETKSIMNLYPAKKEKADLVEVIYATLDGHIYFLDLADGSRTRDPIWLGMSFKGAGSLDPRGYPLMYVGSGDENGSGEKPRMFVISLIDGTTLYAYGNSDPLALRTDHYGWCAFDSSPLVDAESDTLLWPGENGLLYTIKLNTEYDKTAGTIAISPDAPVLSRYDTHRSNDETYWYGFESSVNIVENYLYISENGGMFYCVDLNTMELVWAQDTKDDSNSSPVFEYISAEEAYIYTAPSLHWTKDADSRGTISIYKLDALTGEIVWEKPYDVHTVEGVSGGVQSTALLGKPGTLMEGLVLYSVSRTPDPGTGILVALDTRTGDEVWRMSLDHYAWSSPVAVYGDDGTAYVVLGDSGGYVTFADGATGQVLDRIFLGGMIEASPAVYEDMLVLGTKTKKIFGIQVK